MVYCVLNFFTSPIGDGKLCKIGDQPSNARLQVYYRVERLDGVPDGAMIWTLQFIFPK